MSLPSYQIVILNTSGDIERVFDTTVFDEIRYSRILNGIGRVAFTLRDTEDYSMLFGLDYFIEIYRAHPVTGRLAKEESYFTRMIHRFDEDDEAMWVIGGVSLNHLLKRRLIDPADDPLIAGGYSTKGGAADVIMREYIRQQAGDLASTDRQFPNFSVSAVPGTAESAGYRARYENLLEVIQQLATKGETDFQIERTATNQLICQIGTIGTDKTAGLQPLPYVGISPRRGNIQNPSYLEDRIDEQTFCYALGEGQETNRVLLKIPGGTLGDSPYNRIEFVHDARNAADAIELQTEGNVSLEERRGKIEFTFEMASQISGTSYNEDWVVGDKITGIWDSIQQNLRVAGVEITLDQRGETIKPLLQNIT